MNKNLFATAFVSRKLSKFWQIMKICLFFIFAVLFQVRAEEAYAQRLTFVKEKTTLKEIFQEIRAQSGYHVVWPPSKLDENTNLNANFRSAPLEEVLATCLDGIPVSYTIRDNTIVIKERITVSAAQFQSRNISGTVLHTDNKPIEHVSVTIKGTRIRTVTNEKGQFTLAIPEEYQPILVFRFIGMNEREVRITDFSSPLQVLMDTKDTQLDDVVVTGYGVIQKESFTGNSIRVTQEELLKVSQQNLVDALQVFDPSFRLEVNNMMGSDPNTLPEFYIRGRSGIGVKSLDQIDVSEAALTNNPNLPIFIMDGYEVTAERVYDFDITRIKSITILKDAAATAVYGSRSANGVVVIETVPPEPGRIRLDYNLVTSMTLPDLSDYNLLNAEEKLQAEILAGFYEPAPTMNQYARGALAMELLQKQNQIAKGVNTDWIAQPVQNEFNHKHTLNLDGGTEDLRFNFLLKYDQQNGVMKGSARERKGGGLGIDYRLGALQIRNDFLYDVVDSRDSPYGSFSTFTTKAPYDEIYDEEGFPVKNNTSWHGGDARFLNRFNPVYEVHNTNSFSKEGYDNISNNTSLIWSFLQNFQLKGDIALTKQSRVSEAFIDPTSARYNTTANTDFSNIGELNRRTRDFFSLNTNLFLRYQNRFGGHYMNFSGGFNARENRTRGTVELYSGFPSGQQTSPNFANKIVRKPNYSDNHTRLIGSFVALNYTFQDIYLFDISGRLDGSSEFGSENRFAPFWSLGTGINFHNYQWFREQGLMNRLRLTGTTGELGKTNFPPYAAKGMYAYQQNWYPTGNGALLIGMESTGLTWEKTRTYDLILDMGLMKDMINVNVNFYEKLTNNLVNDVDIPLSSGFTSYKDNIGKVRNSGYELFVRANVIRKEDFLFALYGNFAANKNELLEISNSLKRYNDLVNSQYDNYTGTRVSSGDYVDLYATPHTKYVEGGSLTSIFGMRSLGINPMDGKEIYMRPDGTITYDWSAVDQTIIGDTSPKGQGAFGANISYKGFNLYASFLYQYGAQEYNQTLVAKVENVDLYNRNADRRVLQQRWQNPGDRAPLKDIAERAFTTRPTSRFVQNNDYIKFNSFSLGYDFPTGMIQNYGVSRFRIQLSSNHLGVWSTIMQERGTSYPFARTYDLAIKVVL